MSVKLPELRCSNSVAEAWRTSMSIINEPHALERAANYLNKAILTACEENGVDPTASELAKRLSVHPGAAELLLEHPERLGDVDEASRRNVGYWFWCAFAMIHTAYAIKPRPDAEGRMTEVLRAGVANA